MKKNSEGKESWFLLGGEGVIVVVIVVVVDDVLLFLSLQEQGL